MFKIKNIIVKQMYTNCEHILRKYDVASLFLREYVGIYNFSEKN